MFNKLFSRHYWILLLYLKKNSIRLLCFRNCTRRTRIRCHRDNQHIIHFSIYNLSIHQLKEYLITTYLCMYTVNSIIDISISEFGIYPVPICTTSLTYHVVISCNAQRHMSTGLERKYKNTLQFKNSIIKTWICAYLYQGTICELIN